MPLSAYIWNDPYQVYLGGSYVWVVAESEEEARRIGKTVAHSSFGYEPEGGATMPYPESLDRAPDRVIPLPGGECMQWSE